MNVIICETSKNCVQRNTEKNLHNKLLNEIKKHQVTAVSLLVYDKKYKVLPLKKELDYWVFQIQSF